MSEENETVCDCCHYEFKDKSKTSEFNLKKPFDEKDKMVELCYICSNSYVSNAFQYRARSEAFELMQAMAWIGNHVIETTKGAPR